MKIVAIQVAGSDREPLIIELCPGMTEADILAEAGLTGYVLARQNDPKYLSPGVVLFDLLADCEMLYATTPACEVY
jgi:hypothetical protein